MCRFRRNLYLIIIGTTLLSTIINGQADGQAPLRQRRSGISDQRLAELETIYALSNMRSKGGSVPVAYGLIDPTRIGKRKRSFYLFSQKDVNGNSDTGSLDRVLQRLRNVREQNEIPNPLKN